MKVDNASLYRIAMKSMGYPAGKDPASLQANFTGDEFDIFLNRLDALKKSGKPRSWCNRVLCSRCRHESCSAPFEARRENVFMVVCGNCGESGQFVDSIERWWSLSVWWRPSTWGAGYWETK